MVSVFIDQMYQIRQYRLICIPEIGFKNVGFKKIGFKNEVK
jgi:hypothetical protein